MLGFDELNSSPMFYGNSYFEFTDENIMKRVGGYKTSVHLRLRAFRYANSAIATRSDSNLRSIHTITVLKESFFGPEDGSRPHSPIGFLSV